MSYRHARLLSCFTILVATRSYLISAVYVRYNISLAVTINTMCEITFSDLLAQQMQQIKSGSTMSYLETLSLNRRFYSNRGNHTL